MGSVAIDSGAVSAKHIRWPAFVSHSVLLSDLGRAHRASSKTSVPPPACLGHSLLYPVQIFLGPILCIHHFPSQIKVFPMIESHSLRALLFCEPRQFLAMLAGNPCVPPWKGSPGFSTLAVLCPVLLCLLVLGLFLSSCFSQTQFNPYLSTQCQAYILISSWLS